MEDVIKALTEHQQSYFTKMMTVPILTNFSNVISLKVAFYTPFHITSRASGSLHNHERYFAPNNVTRVR